LPFNNGFKTRPTGSDVPILTWVEQKDFINVLKYLQLSLNYQTMFFPPCYQKLLHTYYIRGETYKSMNGEDLDRAFAYFEKSRDIYIELSKMNEIRINDTQLIFIREGCVIENIDQSSHIRSTIILVYHSIIKYYMMKRNDEQRFKT
jgi:hypothetical protein